LHWDHYADAPVDPSSRIGSLYDIPSEWTIDPPDTWILDSVWQTTVMDWKIEWCGLRLGAGRKLAGYDAAGQPIYNRVGSFIADYWLVVFPLTLMSLWLILIGPPLVIRERITEPMSD
jgi:hypothetical protein